VLPAALLGLVRAGVVDEDAAHHLRGHADELRAVLPARAPLVNHQQVRLVDEGGRLERVVGALAPEVVAGQPPQLVVDERHQLVEGRAVAAAPLFEQLRDPFGRVP
jgi:hypothetical protein